MRASHPQGGHAADSLRPALRGPDDIAAIERLGLEQAVPPRSTHALLARSAELFGDRPALVYLPNGALDDPPTTMTFAALFAAVNRAANAFRFLGVGREDCVALLAPTMPETVIALFGAQAAGRVCPINYMLSPDYIAELIDAAGAKVLVVLGPDPDLPVWGKVAEIRRRSSCLRHVLVLGEAQADAPGFAETIAAQADTPCFETGIGREEIAACFHTGGTSGSPKLVLHTHGNETHVSWFAGMFYDIGPEDMVVNGFPLFHVAGAFVLLGAAIAAGAGTLIPSKLGMRNQNFVRDYWRIIERYGVTLLSGGPTFISTLLNRPADGCDLSRVKALFGGGSPIPAELAAGFEARFGVPMRAIYGMTEAAGLIALVPRHAGRRPGSSGWPLPFCEVAAFAADQDGRPDPARRLPPGELGLLAIRGANVCPGYGNPALTEAARVGDDWLATGDTGRIDPDGQVIVLGRAKDVIIRGGHNIDPLVIEDALLHHPDVEYCAAVGQPDPYAGELPVAFLKLKPNTRAEADAILEVARAHIPEPAAVPKQIYLLDEMPLTTTGKVFKPALRRLATERALEAQLTALLPSGRLLGVSCAEEMGQRKVTISLAPDADAEARRQVGDHMARFAIAFEIAG